MKYPTYMERQLMSNADLKKLDADCKRVVIVIDDCVGILSHPEMDTMYGYTDAGAELMMDFIYPSVKRLGLDYRIVTKDAPLTQFGNRGFLLGSEIAVRKFAEMFI